MIGLVHAVARKASGAYSAHTWHIHARRQRRGVPAFRFRVPVPLFGLTSSVERPCQRV